MNTVAPCRDCANKGTLYLNCVSFLTGGCPVLQWPLSVTQQCQVSMFSGADKQIGEQLPTSASILQDLWEELLIRIVIYLDDV